MKKGFTLAEVLITLAIIGVVAAITIPVVIHKYQQKQLYTQFMKMYNTINSYVDLVIADNGAPENWTYDNNDIDDALDKYVLPYLKFSSKCKVAMNGECGNYSLKHLSGADSGFPFYYIVGNVGGSDILTLADGSSLSVGLYDVGNSNAEKVHFIFDTNGSKGPNTVGRDVFVVYYQRYYDNNNHTWGQWAFNGRYEQGGEDDGPDHIIGSNCDPSSNNPDNGFGCGGRLLLEGKMNY